MKKFLSIVLIALIIVCGVEYFKYNKPEVNIENIEAKETIEKEVLMTNNEKENKQTEESIATNPIDAYYEIKINEANNTFEYNAVANEYVEAWQNEFKNIIEYEKGKLTFEQDKSYYDDYYAEYAKLATLAAEIESLEWVDVTEKPEERFAGTGATFVELLQMKNVYREGAMRLIEVYENRGDASNTYTYIFSK